MLTFDMIKRIYGEKAPFEKPILSADSGKFFGEATLSVVKKSVINSAEGIYDDEAITEISIGITEVYPTVLQDEDYVIDEKFSDYPIVFQFEQEDVGTTEVYPDYPMVFQEEEDGTTEVYPMVFQRRKNWRLRKVSLDDYGPDFDKASDPYAEVNEQNIGVSIIQCIAAVVSLTALVYGIITWITLPKSRTFNNYVYINSIFTLTLVLWLPYLATAKTLDEIVMYCVLFFEFGFLCWLAIASVLMYRDIVLVFATEIKRKMLKCNLFAWGVPIMGLAVLLSTGNVYFYVCYSIILWAVFVVQVFFYVRVLYCLFLVSQESKPSVSPCRNIQIATFTFFMGGIPVVLEIAITQRPIAMALDVMDPMNLVIQIFLLFPMIVYNVFFVIRKSNRSLWQEWREKRKSARLNNVKSNRCLWQEWREKRKSADFNV